MDIWLVATDQGTQIRPHSIHGMLWLQTHFHNSNWKALASGQAFLQSEDAQTLNKHASEAGLTINSISILSTAGKF